MRKKWSIKPALKPSGRLVENEGSVAALGLCLEQCCNVEARFPFVANTNFESRSTYHILIHIFIHPVWIMIGMILRIRLRVGM